VTDDKDRRGLLAILSDFYTADIVDDAYRFSPSGKFFAAPANASIEETLEFIKDQIPLHVEPELFGLHENANISCALAETNALLEAGLSLQPRTSTGEGKSWDETLQDLSADIEKRLPMQFDCEKADIDFPVKYEESMNTVLTQELGRFNRLTSIVKKSLADVQKAIKGIVVMSGELESMGDSMVNGSVPAMWSGVGYPSLKPLGSWVIDLLARLDFLQDWIDKKESPNTFWISGFFFTQVSA
jgi:dynein heavy chain